MFSVCSICFACLENVCLFENPITELHYYALLFIILFHLNYITTLKVVIYSVLDEHVFLQEQGHATCNRRSTKPATPATAFSEANHKARLLQTGKPPPLTHKAKAIAEKHKTKWPFFVMDLTSRVLSSHLLRHTLILAHSHIEVEATYTRFSGRHDGSFGVISEGWVDFATLCKFEPRGVGIFEVISTETFTVLICNAHYVLSSLLKTIRYLRHSIIYPQTLTAATHFVAKHMELSLSGRCGAKDSPNLVSISSAP
ncbi:hypothetical protein AHAS_Ahas05G0088600 [Arachis hypogaea]